MELADYRGGLLSLPLADLDSRLLPGDPRRDAYIQARPAFFQAWVEWQGRELWYLRLSGAPGASLLSALEARGILVLGSRDRITGGGLALPAALLGLALALLPHPRRRETLLRLPGLLPWLVLVCLGPPEARGAGLAGLAATTVAGGSLSLALGRLLEGAGPWSLLLRPLLPLLLALLLPAALLQPSLLPILILLAASSLLLLAAGRLFGLDRGHGGRRRFVALPIGKRPPLVPSLPLYLLIPLVLLPLLALPLPGAARGSAGGEEGRIEAVWVLPPGPGSGDPGPEGASPLPGLEDYRRHLAVQAAFFDSDLRSYPDPLLLEGGGGAPLPRPTGGLEALLRDQGGGRLVRGPLPSGGSPLATPWPVLYILALGLHALGPRVWAVRGTRK